MIIGYARVSSSTQNLTRQIEELKKFGCDEIYTEKESGENFKRIKYNEMRNFIRSKDVLVIHDLSRFGRNKEEIRDEWKSLIDEGIDIVVLNMPILDTRKYKELEGMGQLISDIVLNLLSWLVEEERTRIKIAQHEGIEIAKNEGKFKGKPYKYHANATGKDKIVYEKVLSMLEENKSVIDIHRRTGLARNTIYRIKKQQKNKL